MSTSLSRALSPHDAVAHGFARRDAAHLVRRTRFGASWADIDATCTDGMSATIDRLLSEQVEPVEFVERDETLYGLATTSGNVSDLRAWWAHRMLYSANPLVEKMTLFWHGHFATSYAKVRSLRQMSAQNALFRRHALGNFRVLLHEIARDPAMLVWLDSNSNRRRHPNENFARELMELFALGVGNYEEQDVQQAARAFSGWHVRNGEFWLNRMQLDAGEKSVFGQKRDFDGNDIVDLCLEHTAAPKFLATKLLRFFVIPLPPDAAVDELASCIREHDYEMRPVLHTLFSSSMFFGGDARNALIKSPVELVLGTQRTLEAKVNLRESVDFMGQLGQSLFEPPTVEGWKGGRAWINSASMLGRANFATEIAMRNRLGQIADPVKTAARLNWKEPHDAVDYYFELLLSRDVPAARSTIEDYFSGTTGTLGERLRGAVHLMLSLPEFQLF